MLPDRMFSNLVPRRDAVARLSGWRAALARAAAILLLLNALLPMPAFARLATGNAGFVICTAEGPIHLDAGSADVAGEPGAPSLPSSRAHDSCPICRIAGSTPLLTPPAITLLAPSEIVTTTTFVVLESAPPAHALPRGSLSPRAPPTSI